MSRRDALAWLATFAGLIAAPIVFAVIFLHLQEILRFALRGAL